MTESLLDIEKVSAARYLAARRQPYLSHALFAMRFVPAGGLGTIACDERWRVYIDPEVVVVWDVQELAGVLLHEVGHLVRNHAARARALGLEAADSLRFNVAGDAEINDDLIADGVVLPDGPVTPESLGSEPGKLAEEYLALVPLLTERNCGSAAHGSPQAWEIADGDGLSSREAEVIRTRIAAAITKAAARGDVPGGWRRWATSSRQPTVDWRVALAARLRKAVATVAGRNDYSYSRPSRRHASGSIIFPSMRERLPRLALVIDTSASMEEAELSQILAEIDDILTRVVGRRVPVSCIVVDAEVQSVTEISRSIQVDLKGGGGTDLRTGIEAAQQLRPRPDIAVVLTDGLTEWPALPPSGMAVVVGLTQAAAFVPPWARAVLIGGER